MNKFITLLLISIPLFTFCQTELDSLKGTIEELSLVEGRNLYIEGDKVAIVDLQGNRLTPLLRLKGNYMSVFTWDGSLYAYPGHAFIVYNEANKMGVYTVEGRQIMDFIYDSIRPIEIRRNNTIEDYVFIVKKGEELTFKDTSNLDIMNGFTFDVDGGYWTNENYFVVEKNNKAVFIYLLERNIKEDIIGLFEYKYSNIRSPHGSGVVKEDGTIIYHFEYEIMDFYSVLSPLFTIGKNEKKGIGHISGKNVIPIEYDNYIYPCRNSEDEEERLDFIFVKKDGTYILTIKDIEKNTYVESDKYQFKDVKCEWLKETETYITRVTSLDGKSGIMGGVGEVIWD